MSKVVFVGNVPYNMGEEQLIEVFKSVGQVVGFRLVFDRDTGKPRGYGFCEFADHETAASAVRNLNNVDVGGRPLRIDLADSDPFLEGKTTVRGELVDGGEGGSRWGRRDGGREGGRDGGYDRDRGNRDDPNAFLRDLPTGIPIPKGTSSLDVISTTLAKIQPSQLSELLAQMKAFVITHPDQARALLIAHPQLAYTLFQALVLNKIVDSSILQRMLEATGASYPPAGSGPPTGPARGPNMPPGPSLAQQIGSVSAIPPHMQQHHHPGMPSPHPGYGVPPPGPPVAPPAHLAYPPPPPVYANAPPPGPPLGQGPPGRNTPPVAPVPGYPPYYSRPPMPGGGPPPTGPGGHGGPPAGGGNTPVGGMGGPPGTGQVVGQGPNGGFVVPPGIDETHRQMLLQVLNMTSDQINALPESDRQTIYQVRSQFGLT